MIKNITVVPYNLEWPKIFEKEAAKIKEVLGENCIAIHHVGSTAVPGLIAKPIIDMIVVVEDPEKTKDLLASLGFLYKGEYNIPLRYYFNRQDVNIHMYEENHPEIELNLIFRDYLRSHNVARDEYASLKRNLLQDKSSYKKNNSLFTGYNLGKDPFIRKILKAAHFNQLRMVKCTHLAEWDAIKKEPLEGLDFLLLYQGVDILGYMGLEFKEKETLLKEFQVGEYYKFLFLKMATEWLNRLNCPLKTTRTGVYGVAIKDGKMLLIKQKRGPFKGRYDFPGGGIELGESPEQALKREFIEEVGMEIKSLEYIQTLTATTVANNPSYTFHQMGMIYRVEGLKTVSTHCDLEFSWVDIKSLAKENSSALLFLFLQ